MFPTVGLIKDYLIHLDSTKGMNNMYLRNFSYRHLFFCFVEHIERN